MENKTLKVTGMSCGHCVNAITGEISALPGLADVKVDLKGGTVSFSYDPSITPFAVIEAAIVDAGYELAG